MKAPTLEPTRFFKPRGYSGKRHEVLGAEILALLRILRSGDSALGEDADRLRELDRGDFYPVEVLLRVSEVLDETLGKFGLVRAGRNIFDALYKDTVAAGWTSARDVIHGMDALYNYSNRGIGIGGFQVKSFELGRATLVKTSPQHCLVDEGILGGALSAAGCPATITQTECIRHGGSACTFVITSAFIDRRWNGD